MRVNQATKYGLRGWSLTNDQICALTRLAFSPSADPWGAGLQDLLSLVGYAGLMITASALLFEYVWKE